MFCMVKQFKQTACCQLILDSAGVHVAGDTACAILRHLPENLVERIALNECIAIAILLDAASDHNG